MDGWMDGWTDGEDGLREWSAGRLTQVDDRPICGHLALRARPGASESAVVSIR